MPRITELWAYVVADSGPDDEGVTGFLAPGSGVFMPMVGADAERMKALRPMAGRIATETHRPVVLMRFSGREEIEVISPQAAEDQVGEVVDL